MADANLIGPFTIDINVVVGNKAEQAIATVTVGLAPGKVPTLDSILYAIGQALAALPEGYSLLRGDEFFNQVLVKEKTGKVGNFATPQGFDWDVSALSERAIATCTSRSEDSKPVKPAKGKRRG